MEKPIKKNKISIVEKIAYGGGDLASNLILVLSGTYITFFYTDALGLNPGIVGMIVLFSRLFDGITDIAMGYIMDKTKSKYGKARPWLLWIALPIAVSLILMFLVPNIGDVGKYIYIFITYNLVTTVFYTAINIPYGALNSLLTRDQDERMVINTYRMTMAQMGSLIINAFTLPLVNSLGGSSNQSSWIIVSIIYGVLAFLLFMFCFFKTKERVHITTEKEGEKLPFKTTLKLCFKNDQWLVIVGVWVVYAIGLGIGMSCATYYAKYVLGSENWAGYFSAISTGVVICTMPFLPLIIRKIGKKNTAVCGVFVSLFARLLMLINPGSAPWLMVCNGIMGIGSATTAGTIFAMIADTIEYGQWKTGHRVEGMLYSSTTFGAKIGAGIAMATAMVILGKCGYDGTLAVQSASAISAMKIMYLYCPIVATAILPFLYHFYKLDKMYPQVMADLAKREKEASK